MSHAPKPPHGSPALVADELRARRVKMETAARAYYEYLEAVTQANYVRLFHQRDRELQEPAKSLHPHPTQT